jgi:flagellar biosynthesis chaperone FliJ
MAASRALRRLLRIRDIEEEQSRLALESALGELNRLERALAATAERDRRGRRLVQASARTGELADRLAGIEEGRAADRHRAALAPRIVDAELAVAALRQEFLARRVERRQVETLIQEAGAQDAIEAGRHGQQALDDWYGNRLHREEVEAEPARLATSRSATPGGASEVSDFTSEKT